jgi:uncharacterized membrane protein YhaH (DUF805 family)
MLLSVLLAGLAALHAVALPIFLIALADNEQRANRVQFAIAFLVAASATVAIVMINWDDPPRPDPDAYYHFEFPVLRFAASLLWLAAYAWLGRVTVQRLNEIGRSKKLAFLLLVPYVNFAFAMYLLFTRRHQSALPGRAWRHAGSTGLEHTESRSSDGLMDPGSRPG